MALREHNVATAMYLPDVIGEVVEDVGLELEKKKLSLDTESTAEQTQISRVLERYEKDFFKKMIDEVDEQSEKGAEGINYLRGVWLRLAVAHVV